MYVREGLQGGDDPPPGQGLVLQHCWGGGRPLPPEFLVLLRGGDDPPLAQSFCFFLFFVLLQKVDLKLV